MKGLIKKAVALTAAAALAMTSLVGCGAESVDNNEVAAVVNDSEITAGVANFYFRYQQSAVEELYASMLGDDMWSLQLTEESDETYEESTKASMIEDLTEMYILEDHMADYNVTVSEEALAAIDKAAAAFVEANEEGIRTKVSGEKEIVAEVLRLLTISNDMFNAMVADINREVSDDEAAQKKLQYISFSKTESHEDHEHELEEDDLAKAKKDAEDFLKEAKSAGSLEAYAAVKELKSYPLTFDAETTSLNEKVIKAANSLKENEFSDVIETDSAFYVVQLTSEFDKDATEAEKENIIVERENEKYSEVLEGFKNASEVTVNEEVIAKISLHGLAVTPKAEEKED